MSILLVIYRCTYKSKKLSQCLFNSPRRLEVLYSFTHAYKVFEVNEYS